MKNLYDHLLGEAKRKMAMGLGLTHDEIELLLDDDYELEGEAYAEELANDGSANISKNEVGKNRREKQYDLYRYGRGSH